MNSKIGQWRCPPGEAYAMQWGLEYRVRTETEIDWYLQRNLYFLEDYFRAKTESESLSNQQKIMGLVESQPGITLLKLLEWELNPDEIYSLIVTKQIYVDLSAADLASEPEKVRVFLSIESAKAASQLSESWNSTDKNLISQGLIQPTIGSQIVWDGIDWLVLNLGNTEVTLLNSQQKIINLPLAVFEQLITQAQLTVISPNSFKQSNVGLLIKSASESDCVEANRRCRV